VVKLLLERGANPLSENAAGTTALMIAASGGSVDLVRCLLDHPCVAASIDSANKNGKTGRESASWAQPPGLLAEGCACCRFSHIAS
jgi:ankyrin repeat protein